MGGTSNLNEKWGLVAKILGLARGHFEAVCAEFKLSPPQGFALEALDPGRAMTMGDLAQALKCHASNVTGIVDRLEARRLIERRVADHDRRVKTLLLTKKGAELRERFLARLNDVPSSIASLWAKDEKTLRDTLRRISNQS